MYRKCRFCGVKVKSDNLEKHVLMIHLGAVNELRWIPASDRCLICSKPTTTHRSVCEEHIENPLKFLVPKVLLPLRVKVDADLRAAESGCTEYFILKCSLLLYLGFGSDPENKNEASRWFANSSVFLGYSLVRLSQAIRAVAERAYDLASRNEYTFAGKIEPNRYDTPFLDSMQTEYEFFEATLYGTKRFFDIAVDGAGGVVVTATVARKRT
jgi:hypothetical protein